MGDSPQLLSRDDFRNSVFERDGYACVMCPAPALDAHHILERRLWPDGGYYLGNGASVCEVHHIAAEQTTLSCDDLRAAAGIKQILLPPHLYEDQAYDKWGNPILPNGTRLRGELFFDESVQKILGAGGMLPVFSSRVKYPRTHHLPWSPGLNNDDRVMPSLAGLEGQEVVVTLKMDGENTTFYRDGLHARSLSYEPHPSRDRLKVLHASIAPNIPPDWRVCGENLFARHSIAYTDLPGWFMVFGVWNERNELLPWDETVEWATLLELPVVAVIYRGVFDRARIEAAFAPFAAAHEGYVVRRAQGFAYSGFRHHVGKWVRRNHVQTHGGWMRQRVEANELAFNSEIAISRP